ncbi:MAG: hypothetical protein BWX88_02768 [Planctomycetes bacterium ADurb.Bin126]|nr:MAG: hypothetical protein BWX88_02768 [Planctomycetes bacterium ADurb.Bin126]HOD79947.1 hypothetical protein [Phycisphaerae bacterium]HQL73238.1 hypothetical protein [Phycisphaerae bacterium]
MTEDYLANEDLAALDATITALGLPHGEYGSSDWRYWAYKLVERMQAVCLPLGLRPYKDDSDDLHLGVKPGLFFNRSAAVSYAGTSTQDLTDDATNYVYLTPAGVLTVNTTGFPTTPHVPICTVATGTASAAGLSGYYDIEDITDLRGRAVFAPVGLATVTFGAEAADVIRVTVTTGLAQRQRVRLWIAAADYGTPDATGNTYTLVTGTALATRTANADYEVISDASGIAAFDLEVSGAASRYVLAEIDGRIVSSGEITFAA